MREFTVFAPAKLNLFLDVLDKRPDGYHNIETLFEKIDLQDEITVRENSSSIQVKVEPPLCPAGKDNIVYKAVTALLKEAKVDLDLEIVIKKKIPVASGLGGGSSDASAILLSINKEFGLSVPFERLLSIAATVGKDCPFFMLGQAFAIGRDAGETLEPIDTRYSFSHVIVKPKIYISTAQMYKRLNGFGSKREGVDIGKMVSAIKKNDVDLVKENFYNRFEEVLAEEGRYIEKAKTLLRDAGGYPSFLSGSGPSVFCIVKDIEEAHKIADRIPRQSDMEIFLASTLKGGCSYGDN